MIPPPIWVENDRVALLEWEISLMHSQNAELRAALEESDRNPFGEYPVFRSGSWCGNGPECPCAHPTLPCRAFEGVPGVDPFCPCCGWNEAGHVAHQRARRRRVQRWREERLAVATVRRITTDGWNKGHWRVMVMRESGAGEGRTYPQWGDAIWAANRLAGARVALMSPARTA